MTHLKRCKTSDFIPIYFLETFVDIHHPINSQGGTAFTHRRFYTQRLLHTDTFTHKHFPFRPKWLRFVALRRHRPRLKREIERRAGERKEERERRSADVKVRGSRSADVKV